jgi:hypothetical protein
VSPLREEPTEVPETAAAMGKEADAAAAAVFDENDAATRPVIVKLARIMASLPELRPEGRNQHFGYSFIKDTQVSGALRKRLAEERLMVIPDVVSEEWIETKTARGGSSWVTKEKILFTVIDGDSGDQVSGHGFGYGDDAGDKGANKAFTAAFKYWLIKLFQIGGEDSESDATADTRAADRQAGSAAERGVTVENAQIEGVARGGKQDKISRQQGNTIAGLVKDLGLEPLAFAEMLGKYLPAKLILPENDDEVGQTIRTAMATLSGDDAGALISDLVNERDARLQQEDPGSSYG